MDFNEAVYLPEYITSMAALGNMSLRQQDGYIFVYNVANWGSFSTIEQIYRNAQRSRDTYNPLPGVLVGVGCLDQDKRVVTAKTGRGLANKLGMKFFEVDLETDLNVMETFFELVREIRRLGPGW